MKRWIKDIADMELGGVLLASIAAMIPLMIGGGYDRQGSFSGKW